MTMIKQPLPILALALSVLLCGVGCKQSQHPIDKATPISPATSEEAYKEVTIIIALSAVAPAGIVGHAGIAIEDEYYDFGPARTDRFQKLQGFRSPAGPWWDDPQQDGSADYQLEDVLARLGEKVHPEGSLVAIATLAVTPEQARQYEEYWEALYAEMDQGQQTYSLLGQQCANTIAASLVYSDPQLHNGQAPPLPHRLRGMSPTRLYRFLHRNTQHSAGPRAGQRVEFVSYRLNDGQLVPTQTLLNWSELGLTPPVRLKLGIASIRTITQQTLPRIEP